MVSSFCKTLFSIRAAAAGTSLAGLKDLNFLQNILPLTLLSLRYYCISTNGAGQHSFTVSYLINSCGFSPESALSVSKRIHFETPERPDSVISFLKNHGFSQPQIIELIKRRPKLLLYNVEKAILPKFEFFYSKGFTSSELARLLAKKPYVLERSLQGFIIPNFNFFKNLTHCDDKKVLIALNCCGTILQHNNHPHIASNLRLLQEVGVPESYALTIYVERPEIFTMKHDKFKTVIEEVKKMGFDPSKFAFLDAFHSFLRQSKSMWERKFNLFKEWGWSEEETWCAFQKVPKVMLISERNINATMDFYANKMGWKSQYFAYRPHLILLSLEKRIIPRCSVLQYLLSKGLIKEDYNVQRVLMYTEKQFLEKFVNPYEDPHLLKLYEENPGLQDK